jgi:phosphoserine phosphatase RsbU/P
LTFVDTVARTAPPNKHLRLYTEQLPKPRAAALEAIGCLPQLRQAFQLATGWSLRYDHRKASVETVAPGQSCQAGEAETPAAAPTVSRLPAVSVAAPIDRMPAESLSQAIGNVLGELIETRSALWQREAELAAGVPVVPHRAEQAHLAARLEAVLRAGAQAIGCDAAALYMLDDATTQLKMRSSWGLPFDRLTAPPRPLQGAVADLEALLGHAVVLDDRTAVQTWNMPENFPAAVCVPVSTPTMLLGTLWAFSNRHRDFNDRETNILEVIAGRLASDLEREMLLCAGTEGAVVQKQLSAAQRLQRNELPAIAPLLDGWELAGRTAQGCELGGAFHDWFCLPGGLLAMAVGRAAEQGIAGALSSNGLKTALRSHARYHRQAERILQQCNLTLWTGSAGDQHAMLFLGLLETATGRVCCSSAGRPSVLKLQASGWQSLSRATAAIGESPETDFEQFGYELAPGEALIICTDSFCDAADDRTRALSEAVLGESLQSKLNLSAEELRITAQAVLQERNPSTEARDRSILVVKRAILTSSGRPID